MGGGHRLVASELDLGCGGGHQEQSVPRRRLEIGIGRVSQPEGQASETMRLLVLVNLHASRAEQGLGGALTSLIANGFDLDIRSPADRHSSAQLIGALGPSVDAIVVAGGDGTLNG